MPLRITILLVFFCFIGWGFVNGSGASEVSPLSLDGITDSMGSHVPHTNVPSSFWPLPDDGPRYTSPASGPGTTLFQQGVAAYDKRDLPAAETLFREFTEKFPKSPLAEAASAFLAELVLVDPQDARQRLAAIDAYRALLRQFPASANASRARWRIGDLYAEHGWWLEAYTAYKRASGEASVPGDGDRARVGLGMAFLAAKKWSEAIKVFDEIRARTDEDRLLPYATVGLADALYGAKRSDEAKAWYESSFASWPDFFKRHPDALRRYGDAAALSHDDAMARRAYLLLYNLYPRHLAAPSGLISIGDTFRRSDRWKRAHLFYATAMAQYPNTPAATVAQMRLTELGQQVTAGTREGRIDPMIREAIHYAPAASLDPAEQQKIFRMIAEANGETAIGSEARFRLGEHFERARNWAEAVQVYREVSDRDGHLAGDPWPEVARRRLSWILEPWLVAALNAGDDWTALTLFHRHGVFADRIYSGKDILVHMAAVHRRLGFSAEAVRVYQTIQKDPSAQSMHEEALLGLGASYLDQNDFVAARKVFERYRVQYPLGRYKLDVLGFLATALQGQGLWPEAVRLCRQWLELSPKHADRSRMWVRLVTALMYNGETAQALKAFADADREGALVSSEARLRYADLLVRQQRPADAIRQYQAVLQASPAPADAEWAAIRLAKLWRDQNLSLDADKILRDIGEATEDTWVGRFVSALRVDLSHDAGQEGG